MVVKVCHFFLPALSWTQVCLSLILDLTEHTPCLLGRAIACELAFSRVLETWGRLVAPGPVHLWLVCGNPLASRVWLSEFREVIALLSHTTQSTWITLVLLWEKEGSASSSSYHVMPCPCVPRASCYSPLTYSDSSCFSALSPCLFYGPMGPCVLLQEPLHSAPDAWMPFRASPVYLSSHHASLDGPCSDHPPQPCHPLTLLAYDSFSLW